MGINSIIKILLEKIKDKRKDDFEDRQIWKSKMPVWILLDDDNSLPQEKKLGRKVENGKRRTNFKTQKDGPGIY